MKTNSNDEFLVTKEHKRFVEFCNACYEYEYIGICHGYPGIGKTMSATKYSRQDEISEIKIIGGSAEDNLHVPSDLADVKSTLFTPIPGKTVTSNFNLLSTNIRRTNRVIISAREKINPIVNPPNCPLFEIRESAEIIHPQNECCEIIIVDEAERLTYAGVEMVRDFYDRDQTVKAIIFIGMPGLEKRMSRYPQLYSRVGFVHEYKAMSKDEMIFILERYWQNLDSKLNLDDFADHEAMTEVIKIVNGNFRLLNRLFTQISRIMKLNNLSHITKEVIEASRECLLIGTN